MKTLRHILTYLQAALLVGLASACHDDFQSPDPLPDVNIDTGISIRIPNLDAAATRAYGDKWNASDAASVPLQGEGAVDSEITVGSESLKDFWLFIYCADSGNAATDYAKGVAYNKAINLGAIGNLPTFESDGTTKKWAGAVKSLTVDGTSTDVKVPIHPGKYKVYLVANVHRYLVDDKGEAMKLFKASDNEYMPIEESKLQNALLKFSTGDINFDNTNNILRRGYLPMLCQPADVEEAGTGGVFDILSDNVTQLRCNMEFLCAKVRYTVLFDNTPASGDKLKGHSYDEFGTRLLQFSDLTKAVAVSNVADRAQLTGNASGVTPLAGPFYGELKSITYPTNPDSSLEPGTGTDPYTTGGVPTATTAKLAWQGVIYLPENLDDAKRTKLTFNSIAKTPAKDASGNLDKNSDGTLKYSSESANPYEVELIKGAESTTDTGTGVTTDANGKKSTTLTRGKFYDLCLKATSLNALEINFEISEWEITPLPFELGQYYLHVKEPKIKLNPGDSYQLWYETNASKVSGHSPMVKKKDTAGNYVTDANGDFILIPLYKFYEGQNELNQPTLTVEFNTEVGSEYFSEIQTNESLYNFFHIQAGNIWKKIEIEQFEIKQFLTVSPDDVTINVREKISSGSYTGYYEISIKTNFDQYKVTSENWSTGQNDIKLTFDQAGSQPVNFNTYYDTPDNGEKILYLHYDNLNAGHNFWTDLTLDMNLIVTGKNKTEDEPTEDNKDNVKVYTSPLNDNYVIHFHAKDWTAPHIYVYQCLEFPANITYTDKNGNKVASKPIGYGAKQKDGNAYWAALEYSFTGKIAFKGWNHAANSNMLTQTEIGQGSWGSDNQGFFLYNGEFYDEMNGTASETSSWNASGTKAEQRYYMDMDFCAAQRARCPKCSDPAAYNRLYPGVIMTPESNGWWKFELTGVATPGKALIMFSDGHYGDDTKRYPKKDKVGVPLFGYPSREGWFDLNTNVAFSSVDPNKPDPNVAPKPTSGNATFRIEWNKSSNRDYIYFFNCDTYKSKGTYKASVDGDKYYYELTLDVNSGFELSWLVKEGSGTGDNDWGNQGGDYKKKIKDDFEWNGTLKKFIIESNAPKQ